MNDDDLTTDDTGYSYSEPERSNKEAIIVTLLFVGVVGMSMALVGLDINVTVPSESGESTEEPERGEALKAEGLFDAEAVAKASLIPPGELVEEASEALIAEVLYESEADEATPSAPETGAEPAEGAPKAESVSMGTTTKNDPYDDLVMFGDDDTPVRDASGNPVKLNTPKTRVTTSPRSRLPDAPSDSESKERAGNPPPRGEEPPPPAAKPANEPAPAAEQPAKAAPAPGDLKGQMASAKAKLRAGDPVGAAEAYKKALGMGGGTGARLGLAKAQYEMGNTAQAQRELKKVLSSNPRSGGALLLMGSIAQSQGDRAGARSYYQKFLDAHPNSKRADRIRGIVTRL